MASRFEISTEWLAAIKDLRKALEQPTSGQETSAIVRRCHDLYSSYTAAKITTLERDASFVPASSWSSALEISFLWMGGWRPTIGVILVYSLMGMQIEDDLAKILEGIDVPTMAALSCRQLQQLNALQQQNRAAEDELSHRLAVLQMSMADQDIAKATSSEPPPSESEDLSGIREVMVPKLAALRDIVIEAEKLRFRTVEALFDILSPTQSGQCILAALDLTVAVRKLGYASAQQPGFLSPGDLAPEGGAEDVFRAFQGGQDRPKPDHDGRTPLHLATLTGHKECADVLIERGAKANRLDKFGGSPLVAALRSGHENVAALLNELQPKDTQSPPLPTAIGELGA